MEVGHAVAGVLADVEHQAVPAFGEPFEGGHLLGGGEHAGEDDGVRSSAGAFEHDALDERAIEREELVRRERFRDQDGGSGERRRCGVGRGAVERFDDFDAEFLHVEGALAYQSALRLAQETGEMPAGRTLVGGRPAFPKNSPCTCTGNEPL